MEIEYVEIKKESIYEFGEYYCAGITVKKGDVGVVGSVCARTVEQMKEKVKELIKKIEEADGIDLVEIREISDDGEWVYGVVSISVPEGWLE